MNKIIKTLIVAFLFVTVAHEAEAQKFGYINSQELISQLPEVKEANSKIETLKKQLEKKGQEMIQSLQAKYADVQKRQADGLLSPKEAQEEGAKLQAEEQTLVQFEQTSQEKILKKSEELLSPIQEKINNAIKEVAQDQGYTYIFDSSLGLVLYADPGTDVSAAVKVKLGL